LVKILEISKIISSFTKPDEVKSFEPTEVELSEAFPVIEKDIDEIPASLNINRKDISYTTIHSKFPNDRNVLAIDSTAFSLGVVQDGVIGSVRVSVIQRKANEKEHYMDRYGPYIFMITNQNKNEIYKNLFKSVYGFDAGDNTAPENFKMVDRIRNLLERHVQLEVIKSNKDSIILLDGSLIGNTIANPGVHIQKMITQANTNNNSLVAISKFTNLSLKSTGHSILSLAESEIEPTFRGPLNGYIEGDNKRYIGDIYVAKLTKSGEPFRIDIPSSSTSTPLEIFQSIAGLAGDYGYPEELKLAHSTSVMSSIEILELQAASINEFDMEMEENLRKKLFAPLG